MLWQFWGLGPGASPHERARNFVNGAVRELEVVAGSLWDQNLHLAIFYVCTAPVYTWFTYFHLLAPILSMLAKITNIKSITA